MQVSLSDDEVGVICASMLMTPRPEPTLTQHKLVWKLAGVKRDYDRMMAESTPLLLVARLNPRRMPRPSDHPNASTAAEASTVRSEAPTLSDNDCTAPS